MTVNKNIDSNCQLLFCTLPNPEIAKDIATTLVAEKLAACVNILPAIQSVYEWKGQIETDAESLLLIKTTAGTYPELESRLLAIHPYELPELIMVPISGGSDDYLKWLSRSVKL